MTDRDDSPTQSLPISALVADAARFGKMPFRVISAVRRFLTVALIGGAAVISAGCTGDPKTPTETASAPSLDANDPGERADAARDAARKYGGSSS